LGIFGIEGIGQIYVGQVGRGVGILIAGFAFWIIGVLTAPYGLVILIGLFVLFIWQIFDARRLCKEYNNFVSQNGRAPW
jgi:TM2 domain-containing membrane protein YozV